MAAALNSESKHAEPPDGFGTSPHGEAGVELTRPEDLTPLPLAGRALPTLELFSRLLGRSHAPVRVAALRDLAMRSITGAELIDLQGMLDWLQPRSASKVVGQLRAAGLLDQDADQSFRLPRDARVVGALCAALMVPRIDYAGIVRALGRLVSFTLDLGGDEAQALVPFRMAIAVCEEDLLELRRLIEEYSLDALREAAELGQLHAEHMQELLAEQQASHPFLGAKPSWLEVSDRANRTVASLFRLSTEVLQALAEVAEQRLRGGGRLEREDVRAYVMATSTSGLAALLGPRILDPARLLPYDMAQNLRLLDALWQAAARRRPVPPQPTTLDTGPLPSAPADVAEELAAALTRLAQAGGGPLAKVVVDGTWMDAARRFGGVLEAWARYGPPGQASLKATIDFVAGLASVDRDEVKAMTPSRVTPLAACDEPPP